MFEKAKIRSAIAGAALDAGLGKPLQDKINKDVVSGSTLRWDEARAGLRQGVLRDKNEAAAYVCSSLGSFYVSKSSLWPEEHVGRQHFEQLAELMNIVGIQALIRFGVSPLVAPDAYDELVKSHLAKEARFDEELAKMMEETDRD